MDMFNNFLFVPPNIFLHISLALDILDLCYMTLQGRAITFTVGLCLPDLSCGKHRVCQRYTLTVVRYCSGPSSMTQVICVPTRQSQRTEAPN